MGNSDRPVQKSFRGMGKIAPRSSTVPGYKRHELEHEAQCALFEFLALAARYAPRLKWVHSIPNGAAMLPGVGPKLVRAGLTSGVWDIEAPFSGIWEGAARRALHIEMKAPGKHLSPKQKAFRAALEAERAFFVTDSWPKAAAAIVQYLAIENREVQRMLLEVL